MYRYSSMLVAILFVACGGPDDTDTEAVVIDSTPAAMAVTSASAMLRDASGRDLGTLTLTESDSGIQVAGRITGLTQGERGIHLHTVGSCTPTFEAAGGHWNPEERQHGHDNSAGPHRGDLLNLQVQSDSTGSFTAFTHGGRLDELLDVDGASVVIHAAADDYRTDPDGNSGERIACGVVTG